MRAAATLDERLADVLGSDFVERSVLVDYRTTSNSHLQNAPVVRVWGRAGIPTPHDRAPTSSSAMSTAALCATR